MYRFLLIIGLLCALVASPLQAASAAAPGSQQTSVFAGEDSCVTSAAEVTKAISFKRCGKSVNGNVVSTCHLSPMVVGNELVLVLRSEAKAFETFSPRISLSILPAGRFRPPRLATV